MKKETKSKSRIGLVYIVLICAQLPYGFVCFDVFIISSYSDR